MLALFPWTLAFIGSTSARYCTFANREVNPDSPDEINQALYTLVEDLLMQDEFRFFQRCSKQRCKTGDTTDACVEEHCIVHGTNNKPSFWEADSPLREHPAPGQAPFSRPISSLENCPEGAVDYVDLIENPQKYTGFSGPEATAAWTQIHAQKAVVKENSDNPQLTERLYSQLVSGLQASVSAHISYSFYDEATKKWTRNPSLYKERLLAHPERLENMELLYTALLRAFGLALPGAEASIEGLAAKKLVGNTKAALSCIHCGKPDGECKSPAHPLEKMALTPRDFGAFELALRNSLEIIECISCEKCRLWGRIQVLGILSAVKAISSPPGKTLPQTRTEIVTLFSVFGRLSEALHIKAVFSEFFAREQAKSERAQKRHAERETAKKNKACFPGGPAGFLAGLFSGVLAAGILLARKYQ